MQGHVVRRVQRPSEARPGTGDEHECEVGSAEWRLGRLGSARMMENIVYRGGRLGEKNGIDRKRWLEERGGLCKGPSRE